MIQFLSAGVDHVPYAELREDIIIAGNSGAYAAPMAEHVLALALALSKNLLREHENLARGEFNQSRRNGMLQRSVCGILGFGGIGRATARLLQALGARIHAVNTSGRTDEPVDFIGTLADLERVLAASDLVVVSLPLTRATRGLIGKRELEWMKPKAVLINVARGEIVDEDALFAHLASHPDFRAGIDAWWVEPFGSGAFRTKHPFFHLPNLIGSPHNSAMVPGSADEGLKLAAQNVMRFLKGGAPSAVAKREEYLPEAELVGEQS
jgi:phosphoglycerate dehydrogenase-like enzyme